MDRSVSCRLSINLIVFMLAATLAACTMQSAMDCSSGTCVPLGSVEISDFSLKGVVGTGDISEDLYLISASDPSFTIDTPHTLSALTARVLSTDGLTEYCNQTLTGHNLQISMVGCGLANGTYNIELSATFDADSSTRVKTATFEKRLWNLPTQNLSLFSGESTNLTPSSGVGPYTTDYSGFGYFDLSSFNYSVPLPGGIGSETFRITDSFNQFVDYSISRKMFADIRVFASPYASSSNLYLSNLTNDGTNLYALVAVSAWDRFITTESSLNPQKSNYYKIYKSTNLGSSWTATGMYTIPDASTYQHATLVYHNGKLYLAAGFLTPISKEGWVLSESSDEGNTWTTLHMNRSSSETYDYVDMVATNDNTLLIASVVGSLGNQTWGFHKCQLSPTVVCTASTMFTPALNYRARMVQLAKDSNGHIYAGGTFKNGGTDQYVTVGKSTDHGATFTKLKEWQDNVANIVAADVTADGSKIALGGYIGASTPIVHISTDAGVNFSSSIPCAGWNVVDVEFHTNNDIMTTCFEFDFGTYYYYVTKSSDNGATWSSSTVTSQYELETEMGHLFQYSTSGVASLRSTTNFGASYTNRTVITQGVNSGDALFLGLYDNGATSAFAVGSQATSSFTRNGVIYKSTNGGNSWVEDYVNTTGSNQIRAFTKSPTTNSLFAVGDTVTPYSWNVYRNTGASWGIVSSVTPASGNRGAAYDVKVNSTGQVFLIGSNYINPGFVYQGVVMASSDDGATWTTVDTFFLDATKNAEYLSGMTDGADLWVSGWGVDASNVRKWIVRKYSGGTWTTEDELSFGATTTMAAARHIYKGASGKYYSAGEYMDANGARHWVVRVRNNSDGTWSTLLDYQPGSRSAFAVKMLEVGGVLYVGGAMEKDDGKFYGTVRMYKNNQWYTIDNSVLTTRGILHDLIPCGASNMCLSVNSINQEGHYRGVIRIIHE